MKLSPALPKEEWGYVPLDRQGAQLLFRIIAESYERRSNVLFEGESYRMKHALMRQREEEKLPTSGGRIFDDFFGIST